MIKILKRLFSRGKSTYEPRIDKGSHNHEWDDHIKGDEWAYCWICGEEKQFKRK